MHVANFTIPFAKIRNVNLAANLVVFRDPLARGVVSDRLCCVSLILDLLGDSLNL